VCRDESDDRLYIGDAIVKGKLPASFFPFMKKRKSHPWVISSAKACFEAITVNLFPLPPNAAQKDILLLEKSVIT